MPYLFFVMICLIWSSSFILMKKAAIAFSPVSIGWWRVFWGAAVLGLLCWRRGLLQWPQKRHWPALTVVALLGCAAPYVVQPVVVNHQGGAFMAMAVSCVPLLTIVLSIPMLGTGTLYAPNLTSDPATGLGKWTPEQIANTDRKSTRLNSSHIPLSRMPSSA